MCFLYTAFFFWKTSFPCKIDIILYGQLLHTARRAIQNLLYIDCVPVEIWSRMIDFGRAEEGPLKTLHLQSQWASLIDKKDWISYFMFFLPALYLLTQYSSSFLHKLFQILIGLPFAQVYLVKCCFTVPFSIRFSKMSILEKPGVVPDARGFFRPLPLPTIFLRSRSFSPLGLLC